VFPSLDEDEVDALPSGFELILTVSFLLDDEDDEVDEDDGGCFLSESSLTDFPSSTISLRRRSSWAFRFNATTLMSDGGPSFSFFANSAKRATKES
jgi:hypothetical protein